MIVKKEIIGRIVVNDEGKAWGRTGYDYDGWMDIKDIENRDISTPIEGKYYLIKPTDKTYKGSNDVETLSKGRIVEIKRTIITEIIELTEEGDCCGS